MHHHYSFTLSDIKTMLRIVPSLYHLFNLVKPFNQSPRKGVTYQAEDSFLSLLSGGNKIDHLNTKLEIFGGQGIPTVVM